MLPRRESDVKPLISAWRVTFDSVIPACRESFWKWGPYLSERQWGAVREDYCESGDAWNYFAHDHAC